MAESERQEAEELGSGLLRRSHDGTADKKRDGLFHGCSRQSGVIQPKYRKNVARLLARSGEAVGRRKKTRMLGAGEAGDADLDRERGGKGEI